MNDHPVTPAPTSSTLAIAARAALWQETRTSTSGPMRARATDGLDVAGQAGELGGGVEWAAAPPQAGKTAHATRLARVADLTAVGARGI
ncbi:MAG TPA: hypothetical protein VHL80_14015 [Polyangia bacterium]|nr:hypothetical protein [Polyangia bacterium]